MSNISIDNLQNAIDSALKEYGDEASEVVGNVCKNVAKNGIKSLKSRSPKNTGKYARGWKLKVISERLGAKLVIYNSAKPQITHLLENGHAKRNGGRVAAVPHIAPVRDEVESEIINGIEEGLKG